MSQDTSNNVITFPIQKRNNGPQSLEEIYTNIDLLKRIHVEETLVVISSMLLEQLSIVGFDFADEGVADKETIFVLEALQALLMKKYGIDHPFHQLADKLLSTNIDHSITMREDISDMISKMKGENVCS